MPKSRYTIGVLGGFLAGIFWANFFQLDLWVIGGLILGLAAGLIFYWRDFHYQFPLLIILFLLIGFGYFQAWSVHHNSTMLAGPIDATAEIIARPVFTAEKATYQLKIDNRKISLETGRYPEYRYGDILKIKGEIKKPYEYLFYQNFDGELSAESIEKIAHRGNIIKRAIFTLTDRFENTLNRIFSEPEASFAAGLVLGAKRNIPDSLMNDFNRTGTTHIIAVSGYNLTIIMIWISLFLGIFSRRLKIYGSILAITFFTLATGAPASIVRAAILAILIIIGQSLSRRLNMLILILLVAAIMLLVNPYALLHDLSFELSFLAFIGIVYLADPIKNWRYLKFIPEKIRAAAAETTAAQIAVFPILLFSFGRISLVAPLANLAIFWIIPYAMIAVFVSGLFGLIYLPIGHFLGMIAVFFLKYVIAFVRIFSSLKPASITYQTNEWWWLPLYFLLLGYGIYLIKKAKAHQREAGGP